MIAIGPFLFLLDQLSLFALGAALVTIALLLWRRPRHWFAYVLTKVGVMVTVGLILYSVLLPLDKIPPTKEAIGYAIGLAMTGFGLIGVARDVAGKAGSRSGAGDPRHVRGVLEIDEGEHEDTGTWRSKDGAGTFSTDSKPGYEDDDSSERMFYKEEEDDDDAIRDTESS